MNQPKAEPDELFLTAASQPETVLEEQDEEGSDQDEPIILQESDDVLSKQITQGDSNLDHLDASLEESKLEDSRFGSSFLGESMLE